MFATFCLRLAFGLLVCLFLVWTAAVNPRFFRAHFLTALGLLSGALVLLGMAEEVDWWTWRLTLVSAITCLIASMVWLLDKAPGGKSFILLGSASSALALGADSVARGGQLPFFLVDNFTSALFLGTATTAMLLGHSYLIAPNLTIRPLLRLLAALGCGLALRLLVGLYGLWLWTADRSQDNLDTVVLLWLAVRWVVGLLIPLVLGWMAWETTRIRSTQSATGILYVVVIFCFLGELTSQLLLNMTRILL
jgi:hypothetical protein